MKAILLVSLLFPVVVLGDSSAAKELVAVAARDSGDDRYLDTSLLAGLLLLPIDTIDFGVDLGEVTYFNPEDVGLSEETTALKVLTTIREKQKKCEVDGIRLFTCDTSTAFEEVITTRFLFPLGSAANWDSVVVQFHFDSGVLSKIGISDGSVFLGYEDWLITSFDHVDLLIEDLTRSNQPVEVTPDGAPHF